MYLPYIQGQDPEKKIIDTFGGLNRSYSASDNEFSDMHNMSGRDFPYLVTREGREELTNFTDDGNVLDIIVTDNERRGSYDRGTGVKSYGVTDVLIDEEQALFDYYLDGEKKEVRNKIIKSASIVGTKVKNILIAYPISKSLRGIIKFGNNYIGYPMPEILNTDKNLEGGVGATEKEYNNREGSISVGTVVMPTGKKIHEGVGASGYSWDGSIHKDDKELLDLDMASLVPYSGVETNYAPNGYKLTVETLQLRDSNYEYEIYTKKAVKPFGVNSDLQVVGTRLMFDDMQYAPYGDNVSGRIITPNKDVSFFSVLEVTHAEESSLPGAKTDEKPHVYYLLGYAADGAPLIDYERHYTYRDVLYNGKWFATSVLKVDANLLEVHQNRLWGTDTLGTSLYCSNATDFRDWEIDGTNAGGGYVDVPENSPWTAIKEYNGYLYAFKENKMYKIVGNTSLDYAAVTVCDIGCVNHEAVTICDSVMYFLSSDGIYAFTGNLPVKVSDALAADYVWGRFASHGSKMYCSLDKANGDTEFITYDTSTRLWHKEDDLKVLSFVDYADGLYALADSKVCYKLDSGSIDSATPFSITTKKYFYTFDQKAVTSAFLWLDMSVGATVQVEIAYDGGEFAVCGAFTNCRLKYIPIRLRYCDEFQIRISGTGFCRLKQIEFRLGGGGRTTR